MYGFAVEDLRLGPQSYGFLFSSECVGFADQGLRFYGLELGVYS